MFNKPRESKKVDLDGVEAIQEDASIEDSPGQNSTKLHNPIDTKESVKEDSVMIRDAI